MEAESIPVENSRYFCHSCNTEIDRVSTVSDQFRSTAVTIGTSNISYPFAGFQVSTMLRWIYRGAAIAIVTG